MRAVKRAWGLWEVFVEEAKEERSEEAAELARQQLAEESGREKGRAEVLAQKRLAAMNHVARAMGKHTLYRAWNAMVSNLDDMRDNRETVQRVLGRMSHLEMASAFDAYAGRVEQLRSARLLCRVRASRRLFSMRFSILAACFACWLRCLNVFKRAVSSAQAKTSRSDQARMVRVVHHWAYTVWLHRCFDSVSTKDTRKTIGAAFVFWQTHLEKIQTVVRAADRLCFSSGIRECRKHKRTAYRAWKDWRYSQRRLELAACKVRSRWQSLLSGCIFDGWAKAMAAKKQAKEEKDSVSATAQAKELITELQRQVAVARIQHAPCSSLIANLRCVCQDSPVNEPYDPQKRSANVCIPQAAAAGGAGGIGSASAHPRATGVAEPPED